MVSEDLKNMTKKLLKKHAERGRAQSIGLPAGTLDALTGHGARFWAQ